MYPEMLGLQSSCHLVFTSILLEKKIRMQFGIELDSVKKLVCENYVNQSDKPFQNGSHKTAIILEQNNENTNAFFI